MVMRVQEPFTSRTSLSIQLPAQKVLTAFWLMPRLRAAAQELFLLAICGSHLRHQWGQSSRQRHLHLPSQGTVHHPGLRQGILGAGPPRLFSLLRLQQRWEMAPSGLRFWETERRFPKTDGSLVPAPRAPVLPTWKLGSGGSMKGGMGMACSLSCAPKSSLVSGQSFLWFVTPPLMSLPSTSPVSSWAPVNTLHSQIFCSRPACTSVSGRVPAGGVLSPPSSHYGMGICHHPHAVPFPGCRCSPPILFAPNTPL